MRIVFCALVICAVAALPACGSRQPRVTYDDLQRHAAEYSRAMDSMKRAMRDSLQRELPTREAQWAAHGITGYRLAIRVACYCRTPPLAVVTVRGDSATVHNALGQPLSEYHTQWLAFTVPRLFAEFRDALADTGLSVQARFDSTYGFLNFLHVYDRGRSHRGYQAYVEAFEVLPREPPPLRLRQN